MRKFQKVITTALVLVTLSCNVTVYARTNVDEEVPIEIQIAANKYGEQYDISPELIEAIIWHESRYIPTVQNKGCKGLMQISTKWHKARMEKLGVTDIYDIDGNIAVGTDLLAELFETYEDVGIVLGVYHGETNAVANGKAGKLSTYVTDILQKAEELEYLHDKKVTQ